MGGGCEHSSGPKSSVVSAFTELSAGLAAPECVSVCVLCLRCVGQRALVAGVVLLQPPSAGLGALGKGSSLLCFLLTAGLPVRLREFLFLMDPEASCPEPWFAEAMLLVVGFLLGGVDGSGGGRRG